jgi:8-oxo-dGTP diphosphatase
VRTRSVDVRSSNGGPTHHSPYRSDFIVRDGHERVLGTPAPSGAMATPPLPPLPPPHTRIGVGGVLLRGGRVLVNRAVYRDRFTIPSGYVEAGETLARACSREFEEETGVTVRVGRLILTRHKVISREESDVYFAFVLEHVAGEPIARPPEIAEVREVPVGEAEGAPWISGLSRLAIRLAARSFPTWPQSSWNGGPTPGLATEAFHADDASEGAR